MFEPGIAKLQEVPIAARMCGWVVCCLRGCLVLAGVALVWAQDPRPLIGPGATKEEVIDAYGWPSGQSKLGAKEVLSYPQGLVTLENGRVESVAFTMKPPWPPPRPRPGPPAPTPAKEAESGPNSWMLRFDDAAREATRRPARILALFEVSDESTVSRQFDDEVVHHPDFVRTLAAEFVLFRLDFAAGAPISAEVREQNNQFRERHGVATYPTLLLLSPEGALLAPVDLTALPPGESARTRVIAAVRAARDELLRQIPKPKPAPVVPAVPPSEASKISGKTVTLMASLFKAERLLAWALALGVVTVVILFWLVWRKWARKSRGAPTNEMTMRISDAASGLPSQLDLATWPRKRLVLLVAAYVGAEGYNPEVQPAGGEKDIVLRRAGSERPQVVILCAGSEIGVIAAKRVREFFATMTAEGVDTGWYVAPAGFAADAKTFAQQHRVQLIDGRALIAQLRELPPLVLPKVLAKAAA